MKNRYLGLDMLRGIGKNQPAKAGFFVRSNDY